MFGDVFGDGQEDVFGDGQEDVFGDGRKDVRRGLCRAEKGSVSGAKADKRNGRREKGLMLLRLVCSVSCALCERRRETWVGRGRLTLLRLFCSMSCALS